MMIEKLSSKHVLFRRRFFSSREEAAAFLGVNRSGDLYYDGGTPTEHFFFRLEAALAGLTLEDVTEKPWCVAWEETAGKAHA